MDHTGPWNTAATITAVPRRAITIPSPAGKRGARRDGERRSGGDRRDHEMTARELESRLSGLVATSR